MSGGLNKEERLAAEEDERQRKLREATRSLDPPFPFAALAFDPVFFDLTVEAERIEEHRII